MGHSSCSTTQKYLHVDEEEIVSAIMGLVAVIGAGSVRLAQ
jgi:site-specific recombinase XerD